MDMNRRHFMKSLGRGLLVLTAPVVWTAHGIRRVVHAARGARYPGPIKPLDAKEIRRPGKWAG
jgi:hypothetical protein